MSLFDAADPARPLRSAFWRGWLAGSVFFLIATWWISEAFFVDAKEQGWMAPFAVGLLAAGLGLFWGAAALLYRRLAAAGAAAGAGLRRSLLPAGMAARPCADRLPLGPGRRKLAGRIGDLPGGRPGRRLWPELDHRGGERLARVAAGRRPPPRAWALDRRRRGALALAGLYGFGAARLAHAAPPRPTAPDRPRRPGQHRRRTAKYDRGPLPRRSSTAMSPSPPSPPPTRPTSWSGPKAPSPPPPTTTWRRASLDPGGHRRRAEARPEPPGRRLPHRRSPPTRRSSTTP